MEKEPILFFIFGLPKKKNMETKRTNRWVFIPVILSFLIMAAHFSRNDQTLLMIVSALLPFMLIIKTLWARLVLQAALVLGALQWAWSTLDLIEIRKAVGEEWQRLAIILFCVAAFTLVSGLLLYLVKPINNK